ncbi:uncharacterized protein LOC130782307 isoform X2 [Actinidia eriantha]|uniref:uncharacterized protein LOC130782307 isoform X2 n=1 Tax=Actinidia eriantha TaxID=165200 RepID=UPI002583CC1F|nr:uncharacterized protein LOC130782307 isoform X2 [Actinidia eriantha]
MNSIGLVRVKKGRFLRAKRMKSFSGFRRSKAIALSLKDSAECPDVGCSGNLGYLKGMMHVTDGLINERGKCPNSGRHRKKEEKKNEVGKGSITLADLIRVAAAHDFTWIDKDIADMIYYFDSDGDGKP